MKRRNKDHRTPTRAAVELLQTELVSIVPPTLPDMSALDSIMPDTAKQGHAHGVTAPKNKPATLSGVIQGSAMLSPIGAISDTAQKDATAVGLGIADLLAERAQAADIETDRATYSPDIWADVVAMLDAASLDTTVYCAKSGRAIYTLTPDHFGSYLNALALYGDSPLADDVQSQLFHAITTIKSNTTLPQYLLRNATAHAHLRNAEPVSYLLLAIQDTLQREAGSDELGAADYVQDLNLARAYIANHDKGVVTYVTECLNLFLRHIAPKTMSARDISNLLTKYAGQNISSIVETEASLAHLCKRLLQTIFNYLGKYALRPLASISTRDLSALRVHHIGVPIYKEMQAKEAALKIARRERIRHERKTAREYAFITRLEDAGTFDDIGDDIFGIDLETFGLATALNHGLSKSLSLSPDTAEQADTFREIREAARADLSTRPSLDTIFDIDAEFDLSDLGDFDDLDAFPLTDTPAQLAAAGLLEIDEIDAFESFQMVPETEPPVEDTLIPALIAQSTSVPLTLRPAAEHIEHNAPLTDKPADAKPSDSGFAISLTPRKVT